MLHAFSADICRSEKRARDRLTDLFNEDRTPHGGPYLSRPRQQFETIDARYKELVYDLAPAGERALRGEGLWQERAGSASGPWKHRHMVASITAAIELATLPRDDVAFIPQHEILNRANAALRYPVPFRNPKTSKIETRDLNPDALFGIEYRQGCEKSYRFYVVEADRGTEPTRASQFNRKSHLRTFLQYREYVGRGLYKKHLDLTAGLIVLNIVAYDRTMAAMLNLMDEIYPRGCSYQWFSAFYATQLDRSAAGYSGNVDQSWIRARQSAANLFTTGSYARGWCFSAIPARKHRQPRAGSYLRRKSPA